MTARGILENYLYCITGDLNMPSTDWETLSSSIQQDEILLSMLDDNHMCQKIDEPTHVSGNTLDIILVNSDFEENVDVSVDKDSKLSDHYAVTSVFHLPQHSIDSCQIATISVSSLDIFDLFYTLPTCYAISSLSDTLAPNEFYEAWYTLVLTAIRRSSSVKTRKRSTFPFYYSSYTIHCLNKLETLKRRFYRHPEDTYITAVMARSLEAKQAIELDKHIAINNLNFCSTNEAFSFLRALRGRKELPSIMKWEDTTASTDLEKANLFNDFFCSVFQQNCNTIPPVPEVDPTVKLSDVTFTVTEVKKQLEKVPESNTITADNLSSGIIRSGADIISPLVYILFSVIIATATWPMAWKSAIITPIFKSKTVSSVTNYRPISLLPRISLVFERLLFNHLYSKIRDKLANGQHGFRKRRSTVTQLLIYCDKIYNYRDTKAEAASVYFDFQKAFDSVPHDLLLKKVATYGLDADFITLLGSYLSGRMQCVKINNSFSNYRPVTSGVPQGSVLGPLLFAIYINDMQDLICHSDCFLFADDSKLLCTSSDSISLHDKLQADVNIFQDWAIKNKMIFNISKCKLVDYSRTKDNFSISVHDSNVESVNTMKDLGVHIDSNLNWATHIKTKITSATRTFYMIKNNIPFSAPIKTKLNLYQTCVLSILTYASQVWYPDITSIRKLETIQKRALKWITGDTGTGNANYVRKMLRLGTLPLPYLLIYYDLCYLNKLLCNHYDINPYDFIAVNIPTAGLRSDGKIKFQVRKTHTCSAERNFFYRVVSSANRLTHTTDLDLYCSPISFKRQLKRILIDHTETKYSSISSTWVL